jgi:hypothetical protein
MTSKINTPLWQVGDSANEARATKANPLFGVGYVLSASNYSAFTFE